MWIKCFLFVLFCNLTFCIWKTLRMENLEDGYSWWCSAGLLVHCWWPSYSDCWLVSIETILIETLQSNGEIWGAVISCILCCEVGGRWGWWGAAAIMWECGHYPGPATPGSPATTTTHNYCLFSLRSSGETCQDDSHHHHQPATFITERCSCIPKSGEPTQ